MEYKVRHPRLKMYYDSTAMNLTTIGSALMLLIIKYEGFTPITVTAVAMFLSFAVGYTVWYWVGKAKSVATDKFLADISGVYLVYCMIVAAMGAISVWWGVFGVAAAIASLLTFAVKLKG